MPKKLSEVGLELGQKLKNIYNEKSFVVSILSISDNDEDRKKVVEYINSTPDADIDDITLFAVNLRRERDGYDPFGVNDGEKIE